MVRPDLNKIQLDEKSRKVLDTILEKYPYIFFVFGSRAAHTASKYSDIDIFVPQEVPHAIVAELAEKFEISNLPYVVDLVYEPVCSKEFIETIKKKYIPLRRVIK